MFTHSVSCWGIGREEIILWFYFPDHLINTGNIKTASVFFFLQYKFRFKLWTCCYRSIYKLGPMGQDPQTTTKCTEQLPTTVV